MVKVVGIRFNPAGKIYYFDPGQLDLIPGEKVIVETTRGVEYGEVAIAPHEVSEDFIVTPLKKVYRKTEESDEAQIQENKRKEKEAFQICQEKIIKHGLPMKLVDVEYTFDVSKIIFYFTAEGRVDFRQLVRDLASVFRTRIELRQIGVRDEAKMLGGIGTCGRKLCCSTFLEEFEPVSIRMAKDQGLSLNPSKISGICGRLMCCLRFENEVYEEVKSKFPAEGDTVQTPCGRGEVISIHPIKEKIKVKLAEDEIHEFDFKEVRKKKNTAGEERNRKEGL